MNTHLQNTIAEAIESAKEQGSSIAAFIAEQGEVLAEEIVAWHIASNAFGAAIFFVFFLLCFGAVGAMFAHYRRAKVAAERYIGMDDYVGPMIICSLFGLLIGGIPALLYARDALQGVYAPHLVVMETISNYLQ